MHGESDSVSSTVMFCQSHYTLHIVTIAMTMVMVDKSINKQLIMPGELQPRVKYVGW